MIVRLQNWRTLFVAWATSMRGRAYQWGETDCATLVRVAWAVQFGQEMLPNLPTWQTWRSAARAWLCLGDDPFAAATAHLNLRQILPLRARGQWPLGTVLRFPSDHGGLPSFALAVHPGVLMRSNQETGVCWVDALTVGIPLSAWVLEQVEVAA